jgi:non-ribosomal peptide synthetase component E (peptide arylation enzyme)
VLAHDGVAVGEIEIRGPWIASAYFRTDAPEKFRDGWLRTGDVGEWVDGTHLKITDRMKDIIITSGGKNISPSEIENSLKTSPYVKEVMETFDKFAVHLRDEWVPSTSNNCERYFSHTKPTQVKRRFRSRGGVHSFLKTQMIVRTVKHGLISREASLARMRELFPEIEMEAVTPLFTETKQRYLWSRDLEAG